MEFNEVTSEMSKKAAESLNLFLAGWQCRKGEWQDMFGLSENQLRTVKKHLNELVSKYVIGARVDFIPSEQKYRLWTDQEKHVFEELHEQEHKTIEGHKDRQMRLVKVGA